MKTENGNMPAMPQSATEFGYCVSDDVPKGITKREMIAMHIYGHVMVSLNSGAQNGEWEYPSFEDLARQSIKCTDALLKELEK